MIVTVDNNLDITFNDTLYKAEIANSDLRISVYGPENTYSFSWTPIFVDTKSVYINTNFISSLKGFNQEQVVVEFINRDKFKSIYSKRGVNPQELKGYLYPFTGSEASSESIGQTAMMIFLISVGLTVISSFGGNSMEMMWNLMNTLQLIFFLSYVHVNFPTHVVEFFDFLKYANAENVYLKYVTLKMVPEDKFTRGAVNERLGDKVFYLNSADKVPVLILLFVALLLTVFFDLIKAQKRGKCVRVTFKVFEHLKYNFFIRFGMEVFLELTINAVINIYWVRLVLLINL